MERRAEKVVTQTFLYPSRAQTCPNLGSWTRMVPGLLRAPCICSHSKPPAREELSKKAWREQRSSEKPAITQTSLQRKKKRRESHQEGRPLPIWSPWGHWSACPSATEPKENPICWQALSSVQNHNPLTSLNMVYSLKSNKDLAFLLRAFSNKNLPFLCIIYFSL